VKDLWFANPNGGDVVYVNENDRGPPASGMYSCCPGVLGASAAPRKFGCICSKKGGAVRLLVMDRWGPAEDIDGQFW
jgi:hypothetical protein